MTDDTERVLASIDETLDDFVTWDGRSPDAMRSNNRREIDEEALQRAFARIGRHVDAQMKALVEAFKPVARAVNAAGAAFAEMAKKNHPRLAPAIYGDDYRRHHRSCRLCNPAGNPKPLKVDGSEYRRRRNRRRRG